MTGRGLRSGDAWVVCVGCAGLKIGGWRRCAGTKVVGMIRGERLRDDSAGGGCGCSWRGGSSVVGFEVVEAGKPVGYDLGGGFGGGFSGLLIG